MVLADLVDDSHKERNVHRGMAATGVSWLCVDGVCALLFQMCGRWHISDAGLEAKRCSAAFMAMRPDLCSNTPVAAPAPAGDETSRGRVPSDVLSLVAAGHAPLLLAAASTSPHTL